MKDQKILKLISSATLSMPRISGDKGRPGYYTVTFTKDFGPEARKLARKYIVDRGAAFMRLGIPRVLVGKKKRFMDLKYELSSRSQVQKALDARMGPEVYRLRAHIGEMNLLSGDPGPVHIHGPVAPSLVMGTLLRKSFLVSPGEPVFLHGASEGDAGIVTGSEMARELSEFFRFDPQGYDYRKVRRKEDPFIFAGICRDKNADLARMASNLRMFMRGVLCLVAIPTGLALDNNTLESDHVCLDFVREISGRYPFLSNTGTYLNATFRAPRGNIKNISHVIFTVKQQ